MSTTTTRSLYRSESNETSVDLFTSSFSPQHVSHRHTHSHRADAGRRGISTEKAALFGRFESNQIRWPEKIRECISADRRAAYAILGSFLRVCPNSASSTMLGLLYYLFGQLLIPHASFFTRVLEEDPEQVWIGLCGNQEDAKSRCQLFLKYYVASSSRVKPGSGEENGDFQSITSARTVDHVWKELVGHANETVLARKRDENPAEAWRWVLKYTDSKSGRLCGPVTQVSMVRLSWYSPTPQHSPLHPLPPSSAL